MIKTMHPIYLRVLAFLFCVVSLVFGIKFSQEGFLDIESFKKLERLVPSSILGVLGGENQVLGRAAKSSEQNYLRSAKTQTPSLYYRFLKEREERDSDGNTRWVTETDETRSVDFLIGDSSATAYLQTENWTDTIQWSLPKRYSQTQGSYRYSEWRLEPGDLVLAFAWAELMLKQNSLPDISLRFDKPGDYIPIISTLSSGAIRRGIGNSAILEIWGGVSLIALSLMCFVYAAKIHRILAYLSLLTFCTMSILSVYCLASLSSDVRGGAEYLSSQQDKAELAVRSIFDNQTLEWAGWQTTNSELSSEWQQLSPWQKTRIQDIRINLWLLKEVYALQIKHFPEGFYAWLFAYDNQLLNFELNDYEQKILKDKLGQFQTTKLTAFAFWWVLLGFLCFAVLTYFGFRFAKVKRMIENIPTSATLGVSYGLAEVKGKIRFITDIKSDKKIEEQSDEKNAESFEQENEENDTKLKGPLTKQSCVWYRYLVEERRGSGKNARWVTISDDEQYKRFNCEDLEGSLTIDPSDAEIITRHKKVNKKGDMRYSEWLLKPNDNLYALGMAKVDAQKNDRLILGKPQHETDNSDLFILTNYSEKDLMIKKASMSILALVLAFSGMFASAVFYFGMNGQFAATDYLLSAMLAPAFLMFFMLVLHYNDMIFLQRRADRNWANIQVSLKKRADLLPQLQSVLSQYQGYEKKLMELMTLQRKQLSKSIDSVASASNFIQKEHQFLNDVKLAVEAYPDLKANELMSALMNTLTSLENEVALMRTGFNDAVNEYNTRIESFPDVFLAKVFKFEKKAWLGA
jgi:hypothetical protein